MEGIEVFNSRIEDAVLIILANEDFEAVNGNEVLVKNVLEDFI